MRKPRGGANPAPMPAAVADLPELGELPDLEIPDWEGELREAAVIDFMNEVRRTGNIESFASVALRFACSMKQAFAMARFFDLFLGFYFVPNDPDRGLTQTGLTSESMKNRTGTAWRRKRAPRQRWKSGRAG